MFKINKKVYTEYDVSTNYYMFDIIGDVSYLTNKCNRMHSVKYTLYFNNKLNKKCKITILSHNIDAGIITNTIPGFSINSVNYDKVNINLYDKTVTISNTYMSEIMNIDILSSINNLDSLNSIYLDVNIYTYKTTKTSSKSIFKRIANIFKS